MALTTDVRRDDPQALDNLRQMLADLGAREERPLPAARWRDERTDLITFIREQMTEERENGNAHSEGALHAYWAVLQILGANTPEDDKGIVT